MQRRDQDTPRHWTQESWESQIEANDVARLRRRDQDAPKNWTQGNPIFSALAVAAAVWIVLCCLFLGVLILLAMFH